MEMSLYRGYWRLPKTIRIKVTSVLSPRSPRALVIANWPATRPLRIRPPSFLILYCSPIFVVLWSMVTRLAIPSLQSTARVSPRFATCTTLLFPLFFIKTKQHVVPVYVAPTNFS